MEAVIAEIGAARTGLRLSPVTPANDASDSNPQPLFNYVVEKLEALKPVYIHVVEGATGGPRDVAPSFDFEALRQRYSGAWMVNNGYDKALAERALADGKADLVAFGRPFISNPDLVERLRRNAPLNELDGGTLYGGGLGNGGGVTFAPLHAAGALPVASISRLDLRVEPGLWTEAEAHRPAIDAHFAQ
eukprot:gene45043-55097_t